MKTIEGAPELVFKTTIEGVDYYQFPFQWVHKDSVPNTPIIMHARRQYYLTVAVKDDNVAINMKDSLGLDFSLDAMPQAEFIVRWRELLNKFQEFV